MSKGPYAFKNPTARDFQNSTADLASLLPAQNLKFQRADWTLFRTVEGLQQCAGVTKDKLIPLVLKELADNGLDTGANIDFGELPNGGYFIEDDGPGFGREDGTDSTPEEIAQLFSIDRPMMSTKFLRLPQRGMLGNGLRVVAGAVLASEGGSLVVITRGRRIVLRPVRNGSTSVVKVGKVKSVRGTRVEISFGHALPADEAALSWVRFAHLFAFGGKSYSGKSSPHWYDVPSFHELLDASGDRPVRDLIANLDGCTGARAGEIVEAAHLGRAICVDDITRQQATKLLQVAQQYAKPVTPQRLGAVGPELIADHAYAIVRGKTDAIPFIPFVVEAWATPANRMKLCVCVNRTPVTGDIMARRDERDIDIDGCGLYHTVAKAKKTEHFDIWLNITTPYMPLLSNGKAPNLKPFIDEITAAVTRVVRKAHRPKTGDKVTQKSIVLDNLDDVIAENSGDGAYRFNERQVFYGLRPIIRAEIGEELKIGNFKSIIDDYEEEHGEIPGMYREPRGSITHPHRNETITLGTLMVEEYERPEWTFNKLIYIEKEGANEALKDNGWLERHDCTVMSSKGYSTRAARDLIDKLAEHDEPITVFAVTDADAFGSMIYQTLQEETQARGARNITIINLGLHPWEAIAMGLEVEEVEVKQNKAGEDRRKPVADYVKKADKSGKHGKVPVGKAPDGETWEQWLQTHRVELNAMTTPQFIEWLDGKMAAAKHGKLIPPNEVLEVELKARIEEKVRADITERILLEAKIDDQVKAAVDAIKTPRAATLVKDIKRLFKTKPERDWRSHIEAVATERTKKEEECQRRSKNASAGRSKNTSTMLASRAPNWGPSSDIRLGRDYPPVCPSWHGVSGSCSD